MMNTKSDQAIDDGQYTIRVALNNLLSPDQVKTLVAALQVSFDDGTAGMFEIDSSGQTSVVTFCREISDDLEVIQGNLANGRLSLGDADSMVVAQLSDELSEHQDESPYMREIVASMRVPGAAKSMVGNLDPLTFDHAVV
jgi:hypothetical protein